ncbi:MAG: hypothetical protein ACI845_000888 [Gammaproteobacteria bacterium]|jgi:hypothetical protein
MSFFSLPDVSIFWHYRGHTCILSRFYIRATKIAFVGNNSDCLIAWCFLSLLTDAAEGSLFTWASNAFNSVSVCLSAVIFSSIGLSSAVLLSLLLTALNLLPSMATTASANIFSRRHRPTNFRQVLLYQKLRFHTAC